MATKLRPLGDKILIRRAEAETQTASGIFLPESAKEKPQQATVIAVGDGKALDDGTRAEPQVRIGDNILIGKWGGTEVKVDDEEMLILDEGDVLGVIE